MRLKSRKIISLIMAVGIGLSGTISAKNVFAAEKINNKSLELGIEQEKNKNTNTIKDEEISTSEKVLFALEDIEMKKNPGNESDVAQDIDGGSALRVLKEYKGWSYVELVLPWAMDAENIGWIESSNLGSMKEVVKIRKTTNMDQDNLYRGITVLIKDNANELDYAGKRIYTYGKGEFGRIYNKENINGKTIYDLEILGGGFIRTSSEFIQFID